VFVYSTLFAYNCCRFTVQRGTCGHRVFR